MTREELTFHIKQFVREAVEDTWFDWTHRVQTSGDLSLEGAGIVPTLRDDSEQYVAARPANIREAIRAAALPHHENYVFIDLGSGKGRAIFVAAEFSFRRLIGVEFSESMHTRALENAGNFRYRGRRGKHIDLVHGNAKAFAFPEEPSVVYLFNPFGADTMQVVLNNLQASLDRTPRHVVVILLWPRCGHLVAAMPGMRQVATTRRYEIFETTAAAGEV